VVDAMAPSLTRTTADARACSRQARTIGGRTGGPHAGYDVGGLIKSTIALRAAEAIAAS